MKNTINVQMLNEYLAKNNITKTDFCKQHKISKEAFRKIYIKDSTISIITMFKIARAMNMSITQLCSE